MWDGLPHNEKKINKELINNLIAHKRAWMLQNCYDWDCGYPTNFWFIIKDHYDESEYYSRQFISASPFQNQLVGNVDGGG